MSTSIVNATLVCTYSPRYWQEAQKLCVVVSQRLNEAQSEAESLETKYTKAKKLVREYQRRYASTRAPSNDECDSSCACSHGINVLFNVKGGGEHEARGPSEERDGGEGEASQGDSGEIARPGEGAGGFHRWVHLRKWWPPSHSALSQIAQLERKEPERGSNTADTPVTGRQTNPTFNFWDISGYCKG